MFDYNHYVPILKGKQGEFNALFHLPKKIKSQITPFIDIPRPDGNWASRMDTYLLKKAEYLSRSWVDTSPIFLDYDLDLDLQVSGQHFLPFHFKNLRDRGIVAIPVTGLDRNDIYNSEVARIINVDRNGVVVRLQVEDIEDPVSTRTLIYELLTNIKVDEKETHLLLDLRSLNVNDLTIRVTDTVNFLSYFGNLSKWRTLLLAASGFPQNMGGVQPHSFQLIPRVEMTFWETVLKEARVKKLKRLPSFSDYGICHPDILDFDPSMNPSANIRYTLAENWLIVKGRGLKQKIDGKMRYDYNQFFTLAERLRMHESYCGQEFSYGDEYIYNCRLGLSGPGQLPKWREVGTNHHLTLVSDQIANSRVI